jgi:hypothetical protein
MRGSHCLELLGAALLLNACASAGSADKPGHVDASMQADSARPIDATVDVCTSNATCQAAMNLGTVSGDTGAAMLTASGSQAAWLRVRVTEDDSGVAGTKLRVTTRLTSPASSNYDVFVYVNTGSDVIECSTPSGTATTIGTVDELKLNWGEGTVANGNDDSRNISIEVRPISGMCSAAQPWQLVVLGNT